MYYVEVRGGRYEVQDFSDIYLFKIIQLIRFGADATVKDQSEGAGAVKEAIIPSIPNSIISLNVNTGNYIWHISAAERSDLLLRVYEAYLEYQIKNLESAKAPVEQIEEAKSTLHEYKTSVLLDQIEIQENLQKQDSEPSAETLNHDSSTTEQEEEARQKELAQIQQRFAELQQKT